MATSCANPGCYQPGTIQCNTCKTIRYCGQACQAAHWAHHKEDCEDVICRKVGMAHSQKAFGFYNDKNWPQALHHADLAVTKLKQLKDRPVEDLSEAFKCKFWSLNVKIIIIIINHHHHQCLTESHPLPLTPLCH